MLNCKDISKLGSDHLDNNLPFMKKWQVKMHLLLCHKCRNFIEQLRTTIRSINTLEVPSINKITLDKQVNQLMDIAKKQRTTQSSDNRP